MCVRMCTVDSIEGEKVLPFHPVGPDLSDNVHLPLFDVSHILVINVRVEGYSAQKPGVCDKSTYSYEGSPTMEQIPGVNTNITSDRVRHLQLLRMYVNLTQIGF